MPKKKAHNLDELSKSRTDLHFIKPSDIEPDTYGTDGTQEPFNVRTDFGDIKALRESIRANAVEHGPKSGIEIPIRGYFCKESGKFKLTDGERRWRAASELEKEGFEIFIPCRPEAKGYSHQSRLMDLLVTQSGKPLTMLEQARAMARLIEHEFTPKQISDRAGVSTTHVQTCIALLSLPPQLLKAVDECEMTATLAVDIGKELKLIPELDIDDILIHARHERDASESDHITAKHLPILVGKAAVAARKSGGTIDKAEASESLSHQQAPPSSEEQTSEPASVPFRDQDTEPDTATTDENGYFRSGVETIPVIFKAKGVRKAEVRVASRPDPASPARTEWFFGIQLAWPSTVRGGGWKNEAPSIHGQSFKSRANAILGGLLAMRAELELAVFFTQSDAMEELDALINTVAREADSAPPASKQFDESHETPTEPEPVEEKSALDQLHDILRPLQRKLCERERFDTLVFIVNFLRGKKTATDVSKFVMGVID